MDALQQALTIDNQERDAAEAFRVQAVAQRAMAVATAAQVMVDLATARTATAVANAAVVTAAAAPAGNLTFALSPALASTALLNYNLGEGIKIYGKVTSPLDVLFDGESGALDEEDEPGILLGNIWHNSILAAFGPEFYHEMAHCPLLVATEGLS
jgi:hypothetical protein